MKMNTKFMGLSIAVALAASPALAADSNKGTTTNPQLSQGTTQSPSATSPGTASRSGAAGQIQGMKVGDLEGKAVYNAQGDRIGEIDNIVTRKGSQDMAAVIGVGGFLGIGEKKAAVPLNQLSMQGDRIVASGLTKESLKGQPDYDQAQYDEVEEDRVVTATGAGATGGASGTTGGTSGTTGGTSGSMGSSGTMGGSSGTTGSGASQPDNTQPTQRK